MTSQSGQIWIYSITFCLPLLLELLRLVNAWDKKSPEAKSQESFNWKDVFASSIEIIIACTGFIYAIVEKDKEYQWLYLLFILLLIIGIIFEKIPEKIRWLANIILMTVSIWIPAHYLFSDNEKDKENTAHSGVLNDKDRAILQQGASSSSANLKKICAEFLSGKSAISDAVFSAEIEKCTDADEKNLYFACLMKQRENFSEVENYLNDVKGERFKTDKNYILFTVNKSQIEKISALEIKENASWLGIDKAKLQEAKSVIDNCYKSTLSILILDASAGFGRKTTIRGEAFKSKLKEYSNITVAPFDYSQLGKRVNLYLQGFYCKNAEKKGVSEVLGILKKNGIRTFSDPGIYVSKQAENYNVVIVVNE